MNITIKMTFFVLFLVLHLNMGIGIAVSHALFYVSFITLLGLAVIFRKS